MGALVERQTDRRELGRHQSAGRLGRQQQPKTIRAPRRGNRRLLPTVLGRQLGHVERSTLDRQVEQAGLRLSRFGIAGTPPRIVSGSKAAGNVRRAGKDRMTQSEIHGPGDGHSGS